MQSCIMIIIVVMILYQERGLTPPGGSGPAGEPIHKKEICSIQKLWIRNDRWRTLGSPAGREAPDGVRPLSWFSITLSFSKSPRFLHSCSSQESAETDKHFGVFAKLRVIERVAYNFKTLVMYMYFEIYVLGKNPKISPVDSIAFQITLKHA